MHNTIYVVEFEFMDKSTYLSMLGYTEIEKAQSIIENMKGFIGWEDETKMVAKRTESGTIYRVRIIRVI